MSKIKYYSGAHFGNYTILEEQPKGSKSKNVKCICTCGNIAKVDKHRLNNNPTHCQNCSPYTALKPTVEEVRKRCMDKGLKLLSKKYINRITPIKVTCIYCGNTFYKKFSLIHENKYPCFKCRKNKSEKFTIEEVKNIALKRRHIYMSDTYTHNLTCEYFMCIRCQTVYYTSLYNLQKRTYDCPTCDKDKHSRYRISEPDIISGNIYGNLVAIGFSHKGLAGNCWEFKCRTCNKTIIRIAKKVVSGQYTDCGSHNIKKRPVVWNKREFIIWTLMIKKCYNNTHRQYQQYGGKGISVSNKWLHSGKRFMEEMGPCPAGYTLRRKNKSKDFSLENCFWGKTKLDIFHDKLMSKKHGYIQILDFLPVGKRHSSIVVVMCDCGQVTHFPLASLRRKVSPKITCGKCTHTTIERYWNKESLLGYGEFYESEDNYRSFRLINCD